MKSNPACGRLRRPFAPVLAPPFGRLVKPIAPFFIFRFHFPCQHTAATRSHNLYHSLTYSITHLFTHLLTPYSLTLLLIYLLTHSLTHSWPMKKSTLLCVWCGIIICVTIYIAIWWWMSDRVSDRVSNKYIGNIVVGVIVSKESSYIDEWLAHHFYYGVDSIVIFDNNNPNDIQEKNHMKKICNSYGQKCHIIDFNQYDGVGCILTSSSLCSTWFAPSNDTKHIQSYAPTRRQGMAMKELYYYNNHYIKYRWIMMFDVDEYIVTKDIHTSLIDVLNQLPSEVHAVHVPRQNFGTDNHTKRPSGGVRENYCWREKIVSNAKGMARPQHVVLPGEWSSGVVE
jgi:hypothetical protein